MPSPSIVSFYWTPPTPKCANIISERLLTKKHFWIAWYMFKKIKWIIFIYLFIKEFWNMFMVPNL